MKTDRELLELTAKAVGYPAEWHGNILIEEDDGPRKWNPLTDDGDALRLAVKLQMQVTMYAVCTDASAYGKDNVREINDDPYNASRRAIVRAAAAIGEAM